MITRCIIFSLIILLFSCKRRTKSPALYLQEYAFPFNLNYPTKTSYLDKKLKEISGLCHDDNDHIWCINDEDGEMFLVDTSGVIIKSISFGKDDDYEGIAFNECIMYLVESNGNIKVVDLVTEKKIREFDTKLNRKNDIEGLMYSDIDNALYLASKSKSKKHNIRIYQFDIAEGKINEDERFKLNIMKSLDSLQKLNIIDHFIVNFTMKMRIKQFAPSAIALDPFSKNYFILSSRGKLLVVIDDIGEIKHIQLLPKKLFGQPEGMSFDSQGNLYISNEAKSTKPNILMFNRKDSILNVDNKASFTDKLFDRDTLDENQNVIDSLSNLPKSQNILRKQ